MALVLASVYGYYMMQEKKKREQKSKNTVGNAIADKFLQKSKLVRQISAVGEDEKKLKEISNRPGFMVLDQMERALVRKFRHDIKDNKKLLIKMLKSVNWHNEEQRDDAVELLDQWA